MLSVKCREGDAARSPYHLLLSTVRIMWLLGLVIIGGFLATYLWEEKAAVSARLAAGVPVGMTVFGVTVFALAHPFGLTIWALLTALLLAGLPLGFALRSRWQTIRNNISTVLRPPRRYGPLLYFLCIGGILWAFFARTMWETAGGIYTGGVDNYADLAYHIGFIESFSRGDNFPPTHPMNSGVRLTYPFLSDFFAAVLMCAGMRRSDAVFWQNFAMSFSMAGLLYGFTLRFTRDRLAASVAPLLVIFGGGLGFLLLLPEARESGALRLNYLLNLPHDFTEWNNILWWGNPLVYWFATMRGMLLAAPLMLVVWGLLWRGVTRGDRRAFLAAGVLTGLMPLVHTHTFLCTVGMGVCIAVLFRRWREACLFAAVAVLLGAPALILLFTGSATRPGTFLGLSPGWMDPEADVDNIPAFWLLNAGMFVPTLLLTLVWRRNRWLLSRPQRRFYLPFLLCFLAPNIWKFAPWAWDNVKILYVWFFASVPLVALFVARLMRSRVPGGQAIGLTLFVLLTLSGALDVWRVTSRQGDYEVFTAREVAQAEIIARATPPKAVILSAPAHNSAVMLAGRRMFMTYPGFLWTNGLPYEEREQDLKTLYAGGQKAEELLRKHGIGYVLIGNKEREWTAETKTPLNSAFFARFPRVDDGSIPEWQMYAMTPIDRRRGLVGSPDALALRKRGGETRRVVNGQIEP